MKTLTLKEDLRELFVKYNDHTIRQLGDYEEVLKKREQVEYSNGIEIYYENRTLQFLWENWQASAIRTMHHVNFNLTMFSKFRNLVNKAKNIFS